MKPSNRLYSVQQNTLHGTFISAELTGMCCVCVCWFAYTLSCSHTLASENFFRNTRHILPPFWSRAFTPTSLFLEHQFLKYSPCCFQVPAQMLPFRDTFYEHLRQTEPSAFSFSLSSFLFLHSVYHSLMIQWYLFIYLLGPPLPLHTHMLEC